MFLKGALAAAVAPPRSFNQRVNNHGRAALQEPALNEAEWAPRKALKILRAFTTTVCQSTNV